MPTNPLSPERRATPRRSPLLLLAALWLLAVLAIGAWLGWQSANGALRFDADLFSLLPEDDRDEVGRQALARIQQAAEQRLLVAVVARDWRQAAAGAARVSDILARTPVLHAENMDAAAGMQTLVADYAAARLGIVAASGWRQLQDRGADDLTFWQGRAWQQLQSPVGGALPWRQDPFGLWQDWLQERAAGTALQLRDGWLTPAGNVEAVVVLPWRLEGSAMSLDVQEAVTAALDAARQALRALPGQPTLVAAGAVLHGAHAAQTAHREVTLIGLGASLAILLLMGLVFGRLRPVLLVLLPVAVGLLAALAACFLWFGHVHLLTTVFGVSLVGVAEDYGAHFLISSYQFRETGPARLRRLLAGLALALLTTLVAYAALGLPPFPGLRQMAVFGVVGLCAAWLTAVLWLPLLEPRRAPPAWALAMARRIGTSRRLWPVWPASRLRWLTVALLAGGAAIAWRTVTIDDSLKNLGRPSPALLADQQRFAAWLAPAETLRFFTIQGDRTETVLQREEALLDELDVLRAQGVIGGAEATAQWLPSQQRQTQVAAQQQRLYAHPPLRHALHALTGAELAPPDFVPLQAEVWQQTAAARLGGLGWLGTLAGACGEAPAPYASIVRIKAPDAARLAQLAALADKVPGVAWVDKPALVSATLKHYRLRMTWLLAAGCLGVLALLWLRYRARSWRIAAVVASAMVWALAIHGLLQVPLQIFSVLALLLVLGMGVDFGIFLLEHPRDGDWSAWLGVLLSGLSTLLAFGLLALSSTPALHAFGLTTLAGLGASLLLAPLFCTTNAGVAEGAPDPHGAAGI